MDTNEQKELKTRRGVENFFYWISITSCIGFIYFALTDPDGGGLLITGFLIPFSWIFQSEQTGYRIVLSLICLFWIYRILEAVGVF